MNRYSFAKRWLLAGLGVFAALALPGLAVAECQTPEYICYTYPPYLNLPPLEPTWGGCLGPDCFDKSYGVEVTVVAVDDELYPDKFKLRHSGVVFNGSCAAVETKLLPHSISKTTLWLPEQGHCALILKTDNHLYVHFFGSTPDSQCLGWAECVVY